MIDYNIYIHIYIYISLFNDMPVLPFEPTLEEAVKSTIQFMGKDTAKVIEDAMRRSEEHVDSLCEQLRN